MSRNCCEFRDGEAGLQNSHVLPLLHSGKLRLTRIALGWNNVAPLLAQESFIQGGMTMPLRTFFAAGTCLAFAAALSAGEPSAHAGRTSLESLLQTPAELDFGHRQTITVKELLDEIHRKDHISIRFDAPLLAAMTGGGHIDPPVNATAACGEGVAAAWQRLPQPITLRDHHLLRTAASAVHGHTRRPPRPRRFRAPGEGRLCSDR